jgi:hypothetical protein
MVPVATGDRQSDATDYDAGSHDKQNGIAALRAFCLPNTSSFARRQCRMS